MIASPLRLRSALRVAGLAALLVPEGSPEHSRLSLAVEQLQDAWIAGTAAFRALADADPFGLAPAPGLEDLARIWSAGVPEWPASLAPDPAWLRAFWQFQRLRAFCLDAESLAGATDGAEQVKLACLGCLAALHGLQREAPGLDEPAGVLAQAVLVMLGTQCDQPRALACRVAAAGRHLAPLVPQSSLAVLLATLENPSLDDLAALAVVRQEIATAGDKAYGWLLQAVAAILEGPAPAAGLDAL